MSRALPCGEFRALAVGKSTSSRPQGGVVAEVLQLLKEAGYKPPTEHSLSNWMGCLVAVIYVTGTVDKHNEPQRWEASVGRWGRETTGQVDGRAVDWCVGNLLCPHRTFALPEPIPSWWEGAHPCSSTTRINAASHEAVSQVIRDQHCWP